MTGAMKPNVAVYKVPALIEFVDTLPRSGAGKVMWQAREKAWG